MKISRKGTWSNRGTNSISLTDPDIRWEPTNEMITVSAREIDDFTSTSTHDYKVEISLFEFSQMIALIGEKPANENPEVISSGLAPVLRQLIRLVNTCVGKVGLLNADGEQNP